MLIASVDVSIIGMLKDNIVFVSFTYLGISSRNGAKSFRNIIVNYKNLNLKPMILANAECDILNKCD